MVSGGRWSRVAGCGGELKEGRCRRGWRAERQTTTVREEQNGTIISLGRTSSSRCEVS